MSDTPSNPEDIATPSRGDMHATLVGEINTVIERYIDEFDLTYVEVFGCLECVRVELGEAHLMADVCDFVDDDDDDEEDWR